MQVKIITSSWNLRFVSPKSLAQNCLGECDDPSTPGKEIRIRRSLKGVVELDVLIHEMLHAADFFLHENIVAQAATFAARMLWRQTYQRVLPIARGVDRRLYALGHEDAAEFRCVLQEILTVTVLQKSDEWLRDASASIALVLWKLGYRRLCVSHALAQAGSDLVLTRLGEAA